MKINNKVLIFSFLIVLTGCSVHVGQAIMASVGSSSTNAEINDNSFVSGKTLNQKSSIGSTGSPGPSASPSASSIGDPLVGFPSPVPFSTSASPSASPTATTSASISPSAPVSSSPSAIGSPSPSVNSSPVPSATGTPVPVTSASTSLAASGT